jgi:(4S)-4-hydroxy-5-phosphonooxypentane-2,3-dione isomerase
MSFSFIARFRVKPERDAEFVSLIPQMEANSAEEPGTLSYKFYRTDEPNGFAVFESFVDEAADEAHRANPKNEEIIARMIECMDGTYVREYLRPVEQ